MRVLIIGGTGLIGKALAERLILKGHQVWILSRHPEKVAIQGVTSLRWDGRTSAGWENQAAGVDAIINLAGENIGASRWTDERKQQMVKSRIEAGKAVVDAFMAARASGNHSLKVLVQASAIGYYGPLDDQEVSETDPPGEDFLAKLCVEWEASTQPVEAIGIRRVIIRTGLVLSLDGGVLPKIMLPFKLFLGGPMGSGRQWYSWIHIMDEVEAICFLLENETTSGAYNLTAPHPLTNADFGRVIARCFKRPFWMPAPAFALKLALGEMSTLVLDGQKVLPKKLVADGFQFHFQNAENAFTQLFNQ